MGTYTKCCGKASCLQHSSGKSCHGHGVCTIYFLKKNVWFFLRLSMAINRISKTTEQNKAFRNRSPIDPSMMHRTGPKTLGICIQKPYDNPCAEKINQFLAVLPSQIASFGSSIRIWTIEKNAWERPKVKDICSGKILWISKQTQSLVVYHLVYTHTHTNTRRTDRVAESDLSKHSSFWMHVVPISWE